MFYVLLNYIKKPFPLRKKASSKAGLGLWLAKGSGPRASFRFSSPVVVLFPRRSIIFSRLFGAGGLLVSAPRGFD